MENMIRFPGAGLVFDSVAKKLQIFGTEISLYGICIGVGIFLALCFVALEARRSTDNANHVLVAFLFALVFGIAGARGYYVACYYSLFKGDFHAIWDIPSGGMAIYGGILGGVLGAFLVCLFLKESFGSVADTLSLGFLLGQFIGRWGDFFNRASFGEYTTWPTAMQVPLSAVHSSEVTSLMRENLVDVNGAPFIQAHPAFLYESVWCLILLLGLLISQRKKLFSGEVFLRFLASYSFGRFFIESLRTDQMTLKGFSLPLNMAVSVLIFAVSLLILLGRLGMAKKRIKYRRHRQELQYEFEERIAAQEEKHLVKKERKAEEQTEGEYGRASLPDDVRSLLEDIEREKREGAPPPVPEKETE